MGGASRLQGPAAAAGFLWLAAGESALQLSSVEQESMMLIYCGRGGHRRPLT